MKIPNLGEVTKDDQHNWHYSSPLAVPMFGAKLRRIIVEDYEEDEHKEDFHTAIANFISAPEAVLREADEPLMKYFQDFVEDWKEAGRIQVVSSDELWKLIQFGEPIVTRRAYGDRSVYISLECECEWEVEHGLQIVLKHGARVTKLGPYDGHLTNSDAYDDPNLENVIYHSLF